MLLSLACGGGGDPEPTPEPTAAPLGSGPADQALALYVETTLDKDFVEDCSTADAQRDVGKICSVFRGEREGLRAYVLGQTFSEGLQWAILGQNGGQWSVVHSLQLTSENRGVPGIPWPLRVGVDLVVVGADPCVNVREGPALNQKAVDSICDGATVRLGSGPAPGDNFQWWQIEGRTGWVVADYLRYPDAAQ
ncbi:MAG: hypothetical protein GEU75_06615 [Dehalococcoidia bacterium]|nr:hypothetical protein [Dehalococcoidia bacterium]